MESETDVLEMTSPLQSDINTDQIDKVLELKETYESQKKWINLLIRGRFLMQLIPPENVVAVAKKMKYKSFIRLMNSCRWVKAVVTEKKYTFTLHDHSIVIDYNNINWYKLMPSNLHFYRFDTITFCNFKDNVNVLLGALNYSKHTVLVTHVHLINTVAIKELFLYLKPDILTVEVRNSSSYFHFPVDTVTRDEIYGDLRQINVVLDGTSIVELLENVISHFVGKSQQLKIQMSMKNISFDILYNRLEVCMKNLAMSRRKQQIFFECGDWSVCNKKCKIMEVFHSKAKLSDLLYVSIYRSLYYLLCKAEPGFVVSKLSEKEMTCDGIISVEMKYCPTRHELREFAIDLYSNDDGDLKSLRDKIENHFSSINVHDAYYEPFEEKWKFRPWPKLRASELKFILDWKQRKPLPELSWRLPVTEQVEQQLELLRKVVDIQEQWITFLRKGKYIFEEIPHNCVLEILKRMDTKAFVKALRTCKEIKKFIDYGQPTFIKYVEKEFVIHPGKIEDGMDQWVASELECRSRFRFMRIEFSNFQHKIQILQAVVSQLADRNIFCDTLVLFNTVLTEKMMKLRPKYINFCDLYYKTPQNYPEHVIKVHVDITEKGRLISIAEDLVGKHFEVEVQLLYLLHSEQDYQLFMEAIRCCIEKMKSRRNNGRCVFNFPRMSYYTANINQEEISRGHDCFSYIKSTENGQTFIFVTKAAGGVVAGVFSDRVKKFLWQFITTMEGFEKLFIDGTYGDDRILGPEDEIAFAKIRSYFPTATDLHNRPVE